MRRLLRPGYHEIMINWFHIQPLQSLEDLFCGQDAVVSTLGFPKTKEVFNQASARMKWG